MGLRQTIFDLTGRSALVTGGSRGIGKAIALGFAQAGAELFVCSRKEDEVRAAAQEIARQTGVRVEYIAADMARRDDQQIGRASCRERV